jgi:hypothetical protein
MSKSKVRKKNGKKVKYTPTPKGLSKTKMEKLMEMISEQRKNAESVSQSETKYESTPLHISEESAKKLNVISSSEVSDEGPSLSVEKLEIQSDEKTNS